MSEVFGLISGFVSVLAFVPYLRDIFRHSTKPERATWFIWSVLGGIAFFSQLAKGASASLWLTAAQTFGVFFIFLLSLRYGVGGFEKRDLIDLLAAAFGLFLWYLTKNATVALVITMCIDATGSIPTLTKAYADPKSETFSSWFLSGTAGIFAVLAVGSWNLVLLAWPVYVIFINYLIVASILLGENRQTGDQPHSNIL